MPKTIKISDEAFEMLTTLAEDNFYGPGITHTVDALLKEWLIRDGKDGDEFMDPWARTKEV